MADEQRTATMTSEDAALLRQVTVWRKPVGADDLAYERAGDFPAEEEALDFILSSTDRQHMHIIVPCFAGGTQLEHRTPLPREIPGLMQQTKSTEAP